MTVFFPQGVLTLAEMLVSIKRIQVEKINNYLIK